MSLNGSGEFRPSVQRFLFDPDRAAASGSAETQLATQNVLAELGRVDAAAAGRLDAEAFLKEALQDLQEHMESQVSSGGTSPKKPGPVLDLKVNKTMFKNKLVFKLKLVFKVLVFCFWSRMDQNQ